MKSPLKSAFHASALFLAVSVTSVTFSSAASLPVPGAPAVQADLAAIPVRAGALADGAWVGPAVRTKYGPVQVSATISGGKLVAIDELKFPSSKKTSRKISARSLPALERQAVRAQNARVNIVSGATLTSKAWMNSLQGALAKAGG